MGRDRRLIQDLSAMKPYESRDKLREKAKLNQIVKNFGDYSPSVPIWIILIGLLWCISR